MAFYELYVIFWKPKLKLFTNIHRAFQNLCVWCLSWIFPTLKNIHILLTKLHFSSWFLEQIWQHNTTVIITILTEFHWQSMGIFYSPDNHNSHQHTQCNHHCLGMLQRIHIYRPLVNNFQNGILRDNHMLWEMKNRNRLNY